jgi:hypothetical protein
MEDSDDVPAAVETASLPGFWFCSGDVLCSMGSIESVIFVVCEFTFLDVCIGRPEM